ncbi:uncharacterized protein LOC123924185 isoform X2 [Trifolium pratense]|uniref:uncharacterized protein LOC123924185 isoform X2 n=1 Tax=Trifolium pratense TaxID=57577 RepID=UPI001E6900C6|nr:uncharacterized protein LOC123924185 isoform X2 [Trifolium pratense]
MVQSKRETAASLQAIQFCSDAFYGGNSIHCGDACREWSFYSQQCCYVIDDDCPISISSLDMYKGQNLNNNQGLWFVFSIVHLSACCFLCLAEAIFAVIDFALRGVVLVDECICVIDANGCHERITNCRCYTLVELKNDIAPDLKEDDISFCTLILRFLNYFYSDNFSCVTIIFILLCGVYVNINYRTFGLLAQNYEM